MSMLEIWVLGEKWNWRGQFFLSSSWGRLLLAAGNRGNFWRGNATFLIQPPPQLMTFRFQDANSAFYDFGQRFFLSLIFLQKYFGFPNNWRKIVLYSFFVSFYSAWNWFLCFFLSDENYPSSDYPHRKSALWPIFSRRIFRPNFPSRKYFLMKHPGLQRGKDVLPDFLKSATMGQQITARLARG